MNISRLIFVLLLAPALSLQGEERNAEQLFFDANMLVAGGAYDEAVPLYEAGLSQRPSANLHYNLGNAYYGLGNFGRARLHWEKTLAMNPRHSSAATNRQVLLRELDLPEPSLSFGTRIAHVFSFNQWIWIGVLAFWWVLFSVLARRWKKSGWLTLSIGIGAAGLLAAAVSLVLLSPARQDAIVLDEGASLRVAPAPGSPVAAPLRPVMRVRVTGSYGDFSRVRMVDGQEGYLQKDQVEKIW